MDFSRQPCEDRVQYQLYKKPTSENPEVELLGWKHDVSSWLAAHVNSYIWQVEPVSISSTSFHGLLCLEGHTIFGDNIEDEWFIVWLLKKYTDEHPNVIVAVTDNDGEFILIEVAPALPDWVRPDVVQNRIFLYQNRLHIIPQPEDPAEVLLIPESIDIQTAYELLTGGQISTVAQDAVQQLLQRRLADYPQKAAESTHWAQCYLPMDVAKLVQQLPQTVSNAVRAFYYRDPDESKAAIAFKRFLPDGKETPFVLTRVKFTRCLYAQLSQQMYTPPPRYPPGPPANTKDYKAYLLGCKLACGFEIFYQRAARQSHTDLGNTRFANFVANLTKLGYFQGEVVGSFQYRERLDAAKQFFNESEQQTPALTGNVVLDSAVSACASVEASREADSDESWMIVDPAELDLLLKERSGVESLETLFQNVNHFVSASSDFDGVDTDQPFNLDAEKLIRLTKNLLSGSSLAEEGSSSDEDGFYDDLSDVAPVNAPSAFRSAMAAMDSEMAGLVEERSESLDVNADIVSNLLESFMSQQGESGPLTNLLGDWLRK